MKEFPLKKNTWNKILNGTIFSESKVENRILIENQKMEDIQSLDFKIIGMSKKSCDYTLKTLSRYEEYKNFLSFVKRSDYREETKMIDFTLSHSLMPYDMDLRFKLPRIENTGKYFYEFNEGILKNLKGAIRVISYSDHQCLFITDAHWDGPSTKISNTALELMSQTLSQMAMEILLRKAQVRTN